MIAVAAAALAGLVILAGYAGGAMLAAAVLVVQLVLMAGWFRFVDVPGEIGGLVVCVGAGVLANFLPIWRNDDDPLTPLAPLLGLAFLAAVIAQLGRRDGRSRLTESLAATVTAATLMLIAALYVPAVESIGGAALVAAAVAAAAAAPMIEAVPLPAAVRPVLAAGLGTAAGALIGATSEAVGIGAGMVIGLAAGLVASLGLNVIGHAPTRRRPDVAVSATLPIVLGGAVAYVVGRIAIG